MSTEVCTIPKNSIEDIRLDELLAALQAAREQAKAQGWAA